MPATLNLTTPLTADAKASAVHKLILVNGIDKCGVTADQTDDLVISQLLVRQPIGAA